MTVAAHECDPRAAAPSTVAAAAACVSDSSCRGGGSQQLHAAAAASKAGSARATVCQAALFLAVAALTAATALTVAASKSGGRAPYRAADAVLLAEITKLALSVGSVMREQLSSLQRMHLDAKLPAAAAAAAAQLNWCDGVMWLLPGLLYAAQNQLALRAMHFLSPPHYQLLSQLKIVATAACAAAFLRQRIDAPQWGGLLLLTAACALPGAAAADGTSLAGWSRGAPLMAIVALLSGSSGVATEWLLKAQSKGSTSFKNAQLYAWGVLLNGATVWAAIARGGGGGLCAGFSALTWAAVVIMAVQGLAVAWMIQLCNNVIKLFAGAAAMFVSIGASALLFGTRISEVDVAGACVVAAALALYHHEAVTGAVLGATPRRAAGAAGAAAEARPDADV